MYNSNGTAEKAQEKNGELNQAVEALWFANHHIIYVNPDKTRPKGRHVGARPTLEELGQWFSIPDRKIEICKSGYCLDADNHDGKHWGCFDKLWDIIKALLPGWEQKIAVIQTPTLDSGRIVWLCETRSPSLPDSGTLAGEWIEFKDRFIVPGGAGNYSYLTDTRIEDLKPITADEQRILIATANRLSPFPEPKEKKEFEPAEDKGRPGDWLNKLVGENPTLWKELLEPHGWGIVKEYGEDSIEWSAPGHRSRGATSNHGGNNCLCVHTTEGHPFTNSENCKPFEVFSRLNHDGDHRAAAAELRANGFAEFEYDGPPPPRPFDDSDIELWRQAWEPSPSEPPFIEKSAPEIPSDAREPKEPGKARTPYQFNPLSSADFDRAVYKAEWLVKRMLVKGQPTIVGGPKKVLKTNILADLHISLGSGVPFLGNFEVRQTSCCFISGESGEYTIQETARRICHAKGVKFSELDCWWDFRLPRLSVGTELVALSQGLSQRKVQVAIIDPLYLCLLSGGIEKNNAANLFEIGPLLLDVANACLDAGCAGRPRRY